MAKMDRNETIKHVGTDTNPLNYIHIKTFALARPRLFRKKPRTVNIPPATEHERTGTDKNINAVLQPE